MPLYFTNYTSTELKGKRMKILMARSLWFPLAVGVSDCGVYEEAPGNLEMSVGHDLAASQVEGQGTETFRDM